MERKLSPGEVLLHRIDRGDFIGLPSGHTDKQGRVVRAEDFERLCAEHAGPLVSEFLAMDDSDPNFQQTRDGIQSMFDLHMGISEEG